VDLDFRAPAFCAESRLSLDELLAPELRRELPVPIKVQSRLEFDARGTFNRPPSALPSPSGGLDVERELEPRSLAISRPFFVMLHDPESGAIFYVAWIKDPGNSTNCE
jgi:hypothetical protein